MTSTTHREKLKRLRSIVSLNSQILPNPFSYSCNNNANYCMRSALHRRGLCGTARLLPFAGSSTGARSFRKACRSRFFVHSVRSQCGGSTSRRGTGRCLSKDPVEERVSPNLYGLLQTSALGNVDFLGLEFRLTSWPESPYSFWLASGWSWIDVKKTNWIDSVIVIAGPTRSIPLFSISKIVRIGPPVNLACVVRDDFVLDLTPAVRNWYRNNVRFITQERTCRDVCKENAWKERSTIEMGDSAGIWSRDDYALWYNLAEKGRDVLVRIGQCPCLQPSLTGRCMSARRAPVGRRNRPGQHPKLTLRPTLTFAPASEEAAGEDGRSAML